MCRYQYPSSIGGYSLNWEEMVSANNSTDPGIEDVARLMQQLTTSTYLDSSLGVDATSTRDGRIKKCFEKLGYHCSEETDYEPANLITTISANEWPVIMGGYAEKSTTVFGITIYGEGHFWVCDQVKSCTRTVKMYVNGQLVSSRAEGDHYVHCNWGWGGSCNGYFLPWEFNARNPLSETDVNDEFADKTRSAKEGSYGYFQFDLTMWDEIYR